MFNRRKKSTPDGNNSDGSREEAHGPAPLEPHGRYEVQPSLMTDVGCHREANEDCGRFIQPGDSELLESKGLLLIVADGMGGHSGGEVASNLAVNRISRAYYDDASRGPQEA